MRTPQEVVIATFDLTSQIDEILNGLKPADFEITFHTTQEDADTGDNPIANPYCHIQTRQTQKLSTPGLKD